ncbi:two-component system, OmpR family, alkaline phosphatase synthesis response regulator PhoP [Enterococcus sp. DIV0212c]|uniref:winged helix-turn-helix domain-containing protein n=1 Tax=Enterococcus sp. DIV0212c TaxID=2230867 RepID=UPI001A9B9865|nr:winged helix-turn-helix domain-containing protein [Enterococcus sp. DIV0212c]MBO1354334.1 winged helix-turn-helix transcriptional regulator [Enterococcus sp. DIV0212c]
MAGTIGILHIGNESEKNPNISSVIEKALKEQEYSLIEIIEKEQIGLLDGLVISLEKSSDYVSAFQWLIDLKENYSLFIWILSADKESEMIKLYPHLSKNSVIEIIESNQGIENLGIVIKNAMNYKKQLLSESKIRKVSDSHFLDASKLSLVVHDKSIALTRKEFKLIQLLYENLENVVTYNEINKVIYGESASESTAKYKVANFVFHIRSKLKKQTYFEIEIIRTKGYVLTSSKVN